MKYLTEVFKSDSKIVSKACIQYIRRNLVPTDSHRVNKALVSRLADQFYERKKKYEKLENHKRRENRRAFKKDGSPPTPKKANK